MKTSTEPATKIIQSKWPTSGSRARWSGCSTTASLQRSHNKTTFTAICTAAARSLFFSTATSHVFATKSIGISPATRESPTTRNWFGFPEPRSRRAIDAEEFHVARHIRGERVVGTGGGKVDGQRRPIGQIR